MRTGNQEHHRYRVLRQAFVYALKANWHTGPWLFSLLLLATVLSGVIPVATLWIGKEVLDAIVKAAEAQWSPDLVRVIFVWLGLQVVLLVVVMAINRGKELLTAILSKRLSVQLGEGMLRKAATLDLSTFENPQFHDTIDKARRMSVIVPLGLVQRFQSVISGAITFLSLGAMVASLSIVLFVFMVAVCMPLLIVLIKYSEKMFSLLCEFTEDFRKTYYLSDIMTDRSYIPTIMNLELWTYLIRKWRAISMEVCTREIQLAKRQALAEMAVHSLTSVGEVAATGYIVFLAMRAISLSIGQIVMYSRAFSQGLMSIRQGVMGISGIYEDILFFSCLTDYHNLQPRIALSSKGVAAPSEIESIDIQNVSFRYPGTTHYALKNVSISFYKSKSTLLVGRNGAGKSTLVKLMMRLYDPDEGRILLNGIDIREFSPQSLQRAIGAMFQEYARFAASASENIGYGCVEEINSQSRIRAASRMAKAHDFIERLPHKYDSILSKLFTEGVELSLGQWQRISLARLFMKNPAVFIFDEPTASIDIETEAQLLYEIKNLIKNAICIMISHRLFQPGVTDHIVVMDEGQVVESGTYDDLVARDGTFARLQRLYHSSNLSPLDVR